MGFFSRKEVARAAKISARPRFVDADIQRIDIAVKDVEGGSVTIEVTLDQAGKLNTELTSAYSACRPALLSQKQVDRITTYLGMRSPRRPSVGEKADVRHFAACGSR
jgi:hypothetical protein